MAICRIVLRFGKRFPEDTDKLRRDLRLIDRRDLRFGDAEA